MQIGAGFESIDESLVAGKLGENTQFDLRIIGDYQSSLFRMTHEAAPVFNSVWYLLNVRIRAGEAARRRADLAKVCVQPAGLRIDELDHVLAIAGQGLLHRAVFEQLRDDRILHGQRLQLPVAGRVRKRNSEPGHRLRHLLLRIEIDVRARRPEQRSLCHALAQHLLQLVCEFGASLFDDRELFQPALFVHVKAGQLQIDHRHYAFKLELGALDQIERSKPLDQFVAERNQDRRVTRGILQLRFREFEFPVAQPLALVDSFVEITRGNRFQAVTLFDVAGGNHLTGEQGVEQPDDIDTLLASQMVSRSEEHTSELQSLTNVVCRLLLEKKRGDREKGHRRQTE